MPNRTRHAYFHWDTLCSISRAEFERITDPYIRGPFPPFSGRRIRFITAVVEVDDDDVVTKLVHVEPVWITFDEEGRRDEAEAARALHASAESRDDAVLD